MTIKLANRHGQTLKNHTLAVLALAENVWDRLYKTAIPKELKYAILLHDCGKAVTSFQEYIKNKEKKTKKIYEGLYHQEIGIVIAFKYLKSIGFSENEIETITHLIYNHHAKPVDKTFEPLRKNYKNIEELLTEDEEFEVVSFLNNDLNLGVVVNNLNGEIPDYHPTFSEFSFTNIKIMERLGCHAKKDFYLSMLIDCDRMVSSLDVDSIDSLVDHKTSIFSENILIADFINKLFANPFDSKLVTFNKKFDEHRLVRQITVADQASKVRTSIINEPAGGGKTLISLLWAISLKKRIVFVLPRNNPAKGLFDDIVDTLSDIGLSDISVELFLSGEKIKSHNSPEGTLTSDIVITNIHNVLNSMVKNDIADRRLFFYTSTLILDEYHELMQDTSISSLFYRLMISRHQHSDAKTMLLSATPEVIPTILEFYDNDNNLKYFPEKFKHYEFFNKNEIKVNVLNDFPSELPINSCCLTNSINEANSLYSTYHPDILIHGRFNNQSKEQKRIDMRYLFGKNTKRSGTCVSAQMVRASENVSWENTYLSFSSLSTFCQFSGGRTDRFGKTPNSIANIISPEGKKGEMAAIGSFYDRGLSRAEFDFAKNVSSKIKNKDDICSFYNEYYKKHENVYLMYYSKLLTESFKIVAEYFVPTRNPFEKQNNKKTGGKNLLSPMGQFHTIIRNEDGGYEEFSFEYRDIKDMLEGYSKNDILKNVKGVIEKYPEWKKQLKNKNIDLLKVCKNKDTPIPMLGYIYTKEYGWINENK